MRARTAPSVRHAGCPGDYKGFKIRTKTHDEKRLQCSSSLRNLESSDETDLFTTEIPDERANLTGSRSCNLIAEERSFMRGGRVYLLNLLRIVESSVKRVSCFSILSSVGKVQAVERAARNTISQP